VFETLHARELQMNPTVRAPSDGGDTVRQVQEDLRPQADRILDWFHITMRITVMKQMAEGLPSKGDFRTVEEEPEPEPRNLKQLTKAVTEFTARGSLPSHT
jgi:hypothetical protein